MIDHDKVLALWQDLASKPPDASLADLRKLCELLVLALRVLGRSFDDEQTLQAENARLREALRPIVAVLPQVGRCKTWPIPADVIRRAKEALDDA